MFILARTLDDAMSPLFLCTQADHWTQRGARAQGWPIALFGSSTTWPDLPDPALIMIDTREQEGLRQLIFSARQRSIPVVSIHDLGLNPLPSDVVIDGSIFPAPESFPRRDATFYTGTPFLILDPAFSMIHQRSRRTRKWVETVVVNLGGGDSRVSFLKVLEGLQRWGKNLEVIGYKGFVSWGQQDLSHRNWRPVRFRWATDHEPVGKMMLSADLAITAGGLAAYEALCSGTPLLALAYDRFQHVTVSTMARLDACVDLGKADRLRPSRISLTLASLEADVGRREKLSARGREMVDGRGAQRVSGIIRCLISERAKTASPLVV